jgi:hypothetical protein
METSSRKTLKIMSRNSFWMCGVTYRYIYLWQAYIGTDRQAGRKTEYRRQEIRRKAGRKEGSRKANRKDGRQAVMQEEGRR